jgi:Alpha/beta hydrolase domain
MRSLFRILASLLILVCAAHLYARVTRVEITSRTDVLNGKSFGDTGPYERITGRVYYSLAVTNWHNTAIVDLANAVNLKNGEVEFASDFIIVRPKDMAKANGSMLLEVPNRGHSRIISLVDGGDWNIEHNAGDAWLLRNGYTIAMVGWQWDAAGDDALRFIAPIAKDHGKTITGILRGDFMPSKAADEIPLGHLILGNVGGSEYPVSNPDDPRNTLTVRDSRNAPRNPIPRSQWKFAHTVDGKLTPSDRFIHLDGGFQPGKIYEYIYAVQDPVVAGAGFAAIRDFASWSKYSHDALARVKRVYGEGISQNGRFLRDYLYQAFNGDEDGHMALDGILAHVAGAGRGSFNYRFAQPSRDAQPTSSVYFPTDVFPFTDLPETDIAVSTSKVRAGLLDRVIAERNAPKIFFSNTSYEYWGRAAALIHTVPDPDRGSYSTHVVAAGMIDAEISPSVRIYHFTGLQHFSGPFPPEKGTGDLFGRQPQSPLPIKYFWRAMIANMDAWVRDNTEPPPSSYPLITDRNLVPLDKYAFPKIPGINLPHEANEALRIDFGPDWRKGILSRQPPMLGQPFPVLVPQVDADGNERDGIRLPEYAAPLATYAAWNLRDPSIGAPDQRVAFEASWIPFPKTAADRQRTGDPRKSIEERYKSKEFYLRHYSNALDQLIKDRWILSEDRDAVLERGVQEWDFATK